MKANNTQSSFDKTKFSFNSKKKHALSDFNNTNLRETLSVFSFNNNNGEKISNAINIKLGEREEYEFPSKKTMQKELIQKIFTKESGEIISIIRKVNDEMKVIPNANKTENQFHKTSLVNSNQNNTASHFYCMPNPNKISIEDSKGEIIAIRKKLPGEITHNKNKFLINNKQLSHFNNLKPLNNPSNIVHPNHNNNLNELNGSNQNLNNNAMDNLNQTKSIFNESNNNFSTKNFNYNNNNTNYNNSFSRSKSTSNNFFSPHNKKNAMGYSAQEEDQTLYVTQSVRNGLQGIPEHLERKYNMSTKNSVTWNAMKKIFNKRNQGFYCPHCEHCNNIQDENLEQYFAMKEAKNIIRKGFDYICEYFENDHSFLDFLINNNIKTNNNSNLNLNNSGSDFNINNKDKGLNKNNKNNSGNDLVRDNSSNSNGFGAHNYNYQNNSLNNQNQNLSKKNRSPKKNILMGELANSHFPRGQNNQNYNMNIVNGELENIKNNKKSPKFELENLLLTYPKLSNDRNVLQLVTHFLDALINDKISLDHMVTPEIYEKLKENLIAQGIAFRANENELEFDKEISMLFDEATKEKINKLFKTKFKQMKKIENERKLQQEEELVEIRKRFMVLFLIFIQLISEMGAECKEKAILLYRVFKMFFAEQERKWANLTFKIREKIGYYKDLCKTLIENKNNQNTKIDKLNDILFARKLNEENLNDHKTLIYNLIHLLNEKRDQMYLFKTDIEIMNKELNNFVYGFDKIKLDTKIREKIKEIDVQQLVTNINEEMSHKQVSENEKLLLINSDIYSMISGHRNYFYEQKAYYISEINRITQLYEKVNFKKAKYKKEVRDIKINFEREKDRLEKDIQYFREKLSCEKTETLVQTDVDSDLYNKIIKNHNLINYQRSLENNKLTPYTEKIKFNCSKQKPITKKSVLSLIPELYNEKIESDSACDIEGYHRLTMDEFLIKFMREKFKLTKIVKKNCEQTILSIIKFSTEDIRIDLLRRFLGVGDAKIQREVLDCFLTILKNLPISFYKIFEEEDSSYIMNLEECFDVYNDKFSYYYLAAEALDKLIRPCEVYESDNKLEYLGYEITRDKFLLNRFYEKSPSFIEGLVLDYRNKIKNEVDMLFLANQFMIANKDLEINLNMTLDIFRANFKLRSDLVDLDSFFTFFLNKYYFKIKIVDFVTVSVERLINIYNSLNKILNKMWDNADLKRQGIIFMKDFEQVLSVLLGNSENKWKIAEYFKIACGSQEKDFINKNEFVTFCLNNKEILVILLAETKGSLKKTF